MNPKPNGKLRIDRSVIIEDDYGILIARPHGQTKYAAGLVETYNSMLDELARYHALLGDDPQKVADVVNAAKGWKDAYYPTAAPVSTTWLALWNAVSALDACEISGEKGEPLRVRAPDIFKDIHEAFDILSKCLEKMKEIMKP
jgi:hypothetical protein